MAIYIKRKYEERGLKYRSIDHYLANSDEMQLKNVTRLEKLDKDKI